MEFLPFAVIAEGDKLFRYGKFEHALERYNRVLDEEPDNRRALVARSETNSRLGRFEEALADVERVLKRHKKLGIHLKLCFPSEFPTN